MSELSASYAFCERVARARAKNFYYSFLLLPKPKRLAMCAIYAFMRECDDLSDGPNASPEAMARWRDDLTETLDGRPARHPVWRAFRDTVQRYRIPHRYFHEMVDGVASDFDFGPVRTFDDLYHYCYLVASVVGLTIIHIFEFHDPAAIPLAEKCGVAFQLTNILRDVKEDADNGRVYLPQDDLDRFQVASVNEPSAALTELLRFEAGRAKQYYDESRPLLQMVNPDSRAALWALMEIYRRLLHRIEASHFDVLSKRIRLSTGEKLAILLQAKIRA